MALGESAFCENASYLSAAVAFICGRRRMTGRALLEKKEAARRRLLDGATTQGRAGAWLKGKRHCACEASPRL